MTLLENVRDAAERNSRLARELYDIHLEVVRQHYKRNDFLSWDDADNTTRGWWVILVSDRTFLRSMRDCKTPEQLFALFKGTRQNLTYDRDYFDLFLHKLQPWLRNLIIVENNELQGKTFRLKRSERRFRILENNELSAQVKMLDRHAIEMSILVEDIYRNAVEVRTP